MNTALSRILIAGKNDRIPATAFQEMDGLLPRKCPECGGTLRGGLPLDPALRRFDTSCRTCGGIGLNRHAEAA